MTAERLLMVMSALGHRTRMQIISELSVESLHVSALARRLDISRPLLYMHLTRLEEADLVVGELSLQPDGKAIKTFKIKEFMFHVSPQEIREAFPPRTPLGGD